MTNKPAMTPKPPKPVAVLHGHAFGNALGMPDWLGRAHGQINKWLVFLQHNGFDGTLNFSDGVLHVGKAADGKR